MSKPKKVARNVHGGKSKTTAKGPHGGGNKYNQLAPGKGFAVHDNKPNTKNGKKD